MTMVDQAKEEARRVKASPDLAQQLARWWTKKYQLPYNHELFQERTTYDLLVEYYADHFDKNPLEAHRNPDGHVQFKNTGDPLIDRWESLIAEGKTPDFGEAFSDEDKERLERMRARGKARTRFGGSFKSVVEDMERQARLQGLTPQSRGPGGGTVTVPVRRHSRSNFGDGS
jgi:hypothetical protein